MHAGSSQQRRKDKLSVLHLKRKQGRSNSHTVTRPAFIQWQLVLPSGKVAPGQKTKQVTPSAMPSVRVPCSVYKPREANRNFTL